MDSNALGLLRSGLRLRILELASVPQTVPEMSAALEVPATRLYPHVRKLEAAGLVSVVGKRKVGASVASVYGSAIDSLHGTGDLEDVADMLADALRDARASRPEDVRGATRTVVSVPREAAERLLASLEQVVADFQSDSDDGEMVGLTYVLAPVAGVNAPGYRISEGGSNDSDIVRRALFEAATWDVHDYSGVPPMELALQHPDVAMYHEDWGRHGDLVVVARLGSEIVGAAFCRLFTEETHGHGFIDEDIPELGIAVWPGHRGRGVGERLLTALEEAAFSAGFTRLSLSVDASNPARRLYERVGYERVSDDAGSWLMVKSLD